ncbi:hypothetical protein [Sphingomonas sp.]|uniref:hypothetical protein n=1 Tax=Sphingomonas sp. TaxID=28214 RepID=UPI002D80451E|nr:hypothetical protein [Sphingomonas sp.]HEU0045098.1 hypothetical protein [Sphingomonas sp.]
MVKMHLGAKVPNEGARRLAWWIGREHRGDVRVAARDLPGCGETTVERMLAGEVVPGAVLTQVLMQRAGIGWRLWQKPPAGGWFENPEQALQAA